MPMSQPSVKGRESGAGFVGKLVTIEQLALSYIPSNKLFSALIHVIYVSWIDYLDSSHA